MLAAKPERSFTVFLFIFYLFRLENGCFRQHLTRPDYHSRRTLSPGGDEVAVETPTFPPWSLRGFSPGCCSFLSTVPGRSARTSEAKRHQGNGRSGCLTVMNVSLKPDW